MKTAPEDPQDVDVRYALKENAGKRDRDDGGISDLRTAADVNARPWPRGTPVQVGIFESDSNGKPAAWVSCSVPCKKAHHRR